MEEKMNKRIISLLLCVVMLLPLSLTGCSSGSDDALTDIAEDAAKNAITLTMYLLADKPVSPEQEAKIEKAVNKITKANFKVALDLRYYTEDQYTTVIESALEASQLAAEEAKQNGLKPSVTEPGETTEELMAINPETGIPEIVYPTASENQIDIFYLSGFDKFSTYKENKWLKDISSQLSGEAAILGDYIAPQYLTYSKQLGGGLYFVPNNVVAGEYTYLLLNKEVLKKLNYTSTEGFTSLTCENVKDILENVAAYHKDYLPLYSATGDIDTVNTNYYGFDEAGNLTNGFSVIGGSYEGNAKYGVTGNYYGYESVFADRAFTDQLTALMDYRFKGYYGTEADSEKPFAVGFVKGNAELAEIYGDEYEMVAVEKPRLSTDDLFGNGFAVSNFVEAKNVSRAVEIITYLNTNVAFRNLFLYGIEGENYQLIESEMENAYGEKYKYVRRLNDSYSMSLEKTGNTILAYPVEGEYVNIREYQKTQNRDMLLRLDLGFFVEYLETKRKPQTMNMNIVHKVREYSQDVYSRIMACKDMEEFEDLLKALKKEVNKNEYVEIMKSISYSTERADYAEKAAKYGEGCSFAHVYFTWLEDNKIYVEIT